MDNSMPININGYDTCFVEMEDSIGKYFLIYIPPTANKDISCIVGTFINGRLIQQVDYQNVDGRVAYIKAYY